MSAPVSPSVLDRPLRPDLAAFFVLKNCHSSTCARTPERSLTGILAELAQLGRL